MSDVEHEIVEQRRLIEAVLRGDGDEQTFGRFAEALTADFTLCMPDGDLRVWGDIVSGLDRLAGSAPGIVVTIRSVQLVVADSRTVVSTYEEHQVAPEVTTARRSTAVFVRDDSARHGLRWRHLHETWLAA